MAIAKKGRQTQTLLSLLGEEIHANVESQRED